MPAHGKGMCVHIPNFFFLLLTAHNSECLTKFAFLPPNCYSYNKHFFLGLYAKYILCLVFTLTTPFPLYLCIRKRLQRHRTARVSSWVTDLSLWLSLKKFMRKKSRSYALCSSSLTPDCEPSPYISPQTPPGQGGWAGGAGTLLEAWPTVLSSLLASE